MHALFLALFASGASNSPGLPDDSLKIAIVTAISVVLAAAITGFATTYHRRGMTPAPEVTAAQNFIDDLLRRADVTERHIEALEQQRDRQASRVDELERYCWQAGIDPNTGLPVRSRPAPKDEGGKT